MVLLVVLILMHVQLVLQDTQKLTVRVQSVLLIHTRFQMVIKVAHRVKTTEVREEQVEERVQLVVILVLQDFSIMELCF